MKTFEPTHTVMFVEPSWILMARVVEKDELHLSLHDAIYVENIANNSALSIEKADDIAKAHQLPEGFTIRRDKVVFSGPVMCDISKHYAQKEVAAIKGKR